MSKEVKERIGWSMKGVWMNKTILLGQCIINKQKDHPNIKELIAIDGCPPEVDKIQDALRQAGIRAPSYLFKNLEKAPLIFMQKYQNKPEFEEHFYQID
jgi:SOS-response transcriptional repressor LexA